MGQTNGPINMLPRPRSLWGEVRRHRAARRWCSRMCRAMLISALLMIAGWPAALSAAPPVAKEYEVKAAFIQNFAKFTTWPKGTFTNKSAPIIVGILGESPFGASLSQVVTNGTIHGRKGVVREFDRFHAVSNGPALKQCHVVYVSRSEEKSYTNITAFLKTSPVLTVGDSTQFTKQDGMIGFHLRRGRVRFEINLGAANDADIKISSKLLNLATRVTRPPKKNPERKKVR